MDNYYNIDSLSIEITRQCNMRCRHCLRGTDPQYPDFMAWDKLERLIERVDSINDLTITGGEPAMNIKGINRLLRLIQKWLVTIGRVTIVTNATVNMDKLIASYLKYYAYCREYRFSIFGVSNTRHHQEERKRLGLEEAYEYNNRMASALVGWDNAETREPGSYIECYLSEGNAKSFVSDLDNNVILRSLPQPCTIDISEIDGLCTIGSGSALYIDYRGNMFSMGDLSYETQETSAKKKMHYYVGTLGDAADIKTMIDKYNQRIEKENNS